MTLEEKQDKLRTAFDALKGITLAEVMLRGKYRETKDPSTEAKLSELEAARTELMREVRVLAGTL